MGGSGEGVTPRCVIPIFLLVVSFRRRRNLRDYHSRDVSFVDMTRGREHSAGKSILFQSSFPPRCVIPTQEESHKEGQDTIFSPNFVILCSQQESHKEFYIKLILLSSTSPRPEPGFLGGLLELVWSLSLPPKKLGFTAAGFSLQSGLGGWCLIRLFCYIDLKL